MGHTETANMPKAPHLVQTNIWGVLHTGAIREAHDQLNRGWDVVLSIPDLGYFDMPYAPHPDERSEEHTSELQSLMRISYAVFCLKKKTITIQKPINTRQHTTNI